MSTTFSRPTSCGFTILVDRAHIETHGYPRLDIRHDATGEVYGLETTIATGLNAQELVACGRACARAYERTGLLQFAAAHRACQRAWKARRAS